MLEESRLCAAPCGRRVCDTNGRRFKTMLNELRPKQELWSQLTRRYVLMSCGPSAPAQPAVCHGSRLDRGHGWVSPAVIEGPISELSIT